jgi:hypothetical protein
MNAPVPPAGFDRDDITGRHRVLDKSIVAYKARDAINSVGQALRAFEEQTRPEREMLLKSGLFLNRDEQVAALWMAERYEHLRAMACANVPRIFEDAPSDGNQRIQACVLAILLCGHANKWGKFAGNRPPPDEREWLHQIFRTAVAFNVDATVISQRIEDRQFDVTVESLYVRALLLDRFANGSLAPNRLEILDTWLIAWMGALWLTRAPVPGEPTLGVNTASPQHGLVPHFDGDGAHLFLSLQPLQRQLDRTIREFQLGRIFPGWGSGAAVPVEEHVAVIDFLEREFLLIETAQRQRSQRGKRVSFGTNPVVSVFFGFDEICRLAFSSERFHTLTGGGAEIGIRNAINLIDVSEGGLGLDMVEDDARRVPVNELVAIRLEKGKPCMLGVVVRKSPLQRPSAMLVGIKVLAKSPVYSALERVDEATNSWQPGQGILIADNAADGFADSIIVGDKTYVANSPLAVSMGTTIFELYLRRIRQQGPGWRMAAFDAVEAQ